MDIIRYYLLPNFTALKLNTRPISKLLYAEIKLHKYIYYGGTYFLIVTNFWFKLQCC